MSRIDLRDVRLSYGETVALDGIAATIEGPKIAGLIGRNGSGKTSLLSLIAAFRKPDAGEVLIDGEPVWENAGRSSRITLIREGGDVVDEDEKLDEALQESFPASDPPQPAQPGVTGWDADKVPGKAGGKR